MRTKETSSSYNTVDTSMIIYGFRTDADKLAESLKAGCLARLSRSDLKRIAAGLNNIMKIIEEGNR